MIGGAIAADGSLYGSEAGAGFLGGIVAGFLAGYIAKWIKQIKVPKAMAPIMPIIIIPILSSLIVGLIFIFVIGAPISNIFGALTSWLKGMQGANIIILALIGAMIAFDMGGPVNKVAFLFGSALIAEGNYTVMGMVAVAVCTPPIGLGLATVNTNSIKQNKKWVRHHLRWDYLVLLKGNPFCCTRSSKNHSSQYDWRDDCFSNSGGWRCR